MKALQKIFDWRTYIFTVIPVITFSSFVAVLFGQTIPGIILSFFKVAGECVVLGLVVIFAFTWFLKARPHNRPKSYRIIPLDIFGKKTEIEEIRTDFKTHDVAWSYMKQYKKTYPLHNFALVTDEKNSDKPTIFRYI
ncbi:MAG: hypothetical protein MT334_03880 [Candidatus Nitrosopumilus limneticus]|nr:hypothetical protein [Candidatus Nitrosopumilus limneticus]MDA0668320.1 hypothetical protein [Thermoproteota archaeon]HJJ21748.1 hypothetical protein [Nitrosopumilus sp.]MDA0853086.1 hypothetical protein [Thermoproteota archaeon]MDA1123604.1 hypothetical protein [Thermoproteota archaeon]